MSEEIILLVEDELFLRDLYTIMLQKAGYKVIAAEDGEKGLFIGKDNPHAKVMLLDVMLPKMHGVEVLKKLKGDPGTKHLPVIMLSNLSEESVVDEAIHIGAEAYLVKVSFTPQQLIEKVKEIIASDKISKKKA
jgi:DNA-binding response OmpR family regulator